jgi:two-component system response regulator GlrR
MTPRVLIVDDDPDIGWSIDHILRTAGYECSVTASGEAAIAAAESSCPDLVISDLMMPGISGIELAEKLHERIPGVPVIIVTSHGTIPSAVSAMRHGAFGYLTKPFNPEFPF